MRNTIQIIEKAIQKRFSKKLNILEVINSRNRDEFRQFKNTRATPQGLYLAINLVIKDFPIWIIFSKGFKKRPYLFVADSLKYNYIERRCHKNYTGSLKYRFKPTKQDELNDKRKEEFINEYGTLTDEINFPKSINAVEPFLLQLHKIAKCSILAVDALSIEKMEDENQRDFYTDENKILKDGKKTQILSTRYERVKKNRLLAINHHKTNCMACGFNFRDTYGEIGDGFIEVHHLVPLSKNRKSIAIDPKKDLITLCANCHRMIHKIPDFNTALRRLKTYIKKQVKLNLNN